jgi:predicted PurR-regulated permease PerM
MIWAFSRVARAAVTDVARFQAVYDRLAEWLNHHGVVIGSIWSEHFNVGWLLRTVQNLSVRLNSITSFSIVALVYILLGLLEVAAFRMKIERMENRGAANVLLQGSIITSRKIGRYMFVRTQMSVVTGGLVFAFAYLTGLPLAKEWGVLAFVLNYIPFLGPLIATIFPTLYAAVEFQTWQATLGVFVGLNAIQFIVGSYMEPRVSGNALSISPFLVLFSIFFWTFMWGLFGAFIGVPITIAVLTFCSMHDETRWIAGLLGGEKSI